VDSVLLLVESISSVLDWMKKYGERSANPDLIAGGLLLLITSIL
jgi:hypothetical protein